MTIFNGIYNLLTTYLFDVTVPYADLLATLSSGFICLGLVYLCFMPVIAVCRFALNAIFKV